VSTADAVTLAASIAVVICAGVLASAIPAARATQVPIAETIREN
jgi:ABC-type lipoprotein release transport system permease subunit